MFLYEIHCHTKEGSKCASTPAADYIKFYKELGYQGIFITDHFFNGNTCVDKTLPWSEQVEEFCKGYENAKAEGEKQDIDVFFGFEYSIHWCHLLVFGLDKKWLLDNPQVMDWKPITFLKKVREEGALVIHAHPFRDGVEHVELFPNYIDAVEIFNASQPDEANRRAKFYADMLSLPTTSGSDIHHINQNLLSALCFDHRLTDIKDFINSVKGGKTQIKEIEVSKD